jgi:hypothetical protein
LLLAPWFQEGFIDQWPCICYISFAMVGSEAGQRQQLHGVCQKPSNPTSNDFKDLSFTDYTSSSPLLHYNSHTQEHMHTHTCTCIYTRMHTHTYMWMHTHFWNPYLNCAVFFLGIRKSGLGSQHRTTAEQSSSFPQITGSKPAFQVLQKHLHTFFHTSTWESRQ